MFIVYACSLAKARSRQSDQISPDMVVMNPIMNPAYGGNAILRYILLCAVLVDAQRVLGLDLFFNRVPWQSFDFISINIQLPILQSYFS
jgi:hypothetical protein